jgi:hypothetical protein
MSRPRNLGTMLLTTTTTTAQLGQRPGSAATTPNAQLGQRPGSAATTPTAQLGQRPGSAATTPTAQLGQRPGSAATTPTAVPAPAHSPRSDGKRGWAARPNACPRSSMGNQPTRTAANGSYPPPLPPFGPFPPSHAASKSSQLMPASQCDDEIRDVYTLKSFASQVYIEANEKVSSSRKTIRCED